MVRGGHCGWPRMLKSSLINQEPMHGFLSRKVALKKKVVFEKFTPAVSTMLNQFKKSRNWQGCCTTTGTSAFKWQRHKPKQHLWNRWGHLQHTVCPPHTGCTCHSQRASRRNGESLSQLQFSEWYELTVPELMAYS